MPATVRTMLDEFRREIGTFEASLPDISQRDALDGLLGIKHALVETWKAQERAGVGVQPRSDDPGGPTTVIAGAQFIILFLLGMPIADALGVNAGFAVLFALVASGVTAAFVYRWMSSPATADAVGLVARNRARAESDPAFLMDEVQSYVQAQIDAAHERFSAIRMEFERAVIRPRQKIETTLIALCQKRLEAHSRDFPDEERILARIDEYIAQCERALSANPLDERVARQLRETGEQLQALYKYPTQLEYVKTAYRRQEDFVAGVDRIGAAIDATQSTRTATMIEVASQLGDLRSEIGLTNKLVEGFRDYLATRPEIQGVVATGDAEQLMDAMDGSTVRPK